MTSVKDSEETATVGYWKSHVLHYFGEKKENKQKETPNKKTPSFQKRGLPQLFVLGRLAVS